MCQRLQFQELHSELQRARGCWCSRQAPMCTTSLILSWEAQLDPDPKIRITPWLLLRFSFGNENMKRANARLMHFSNASIRFVAFMELFHRPSTMTNKYQHTNVVGLLMLVAMYTPLEIASVPMNRHGNWLDTFVGEGGKPTPPCPWVSFTGMLTCRHEALASITYREELAWAGVF